MVVCISLCVPLCNQICTLVNQFFQNTINYYQELTIEGMMTYYEHFIFLPLYRICMVTTDGIGHILVSVYFMVQKPFCR